MTQRKLHFSPSRKTLRLFIFITIGLSLILLVISITTTSIDTTRSRAAIDQAPSPTQSSAVEKVTGQLLSDIPNIPIYPGALIAYSYRKIDGNKIGYEAEWESPDTVATITKWYVKALPASGWTLTRVPESVATITPPGPLTDIEFMVVANKGSTEVIFIIENEGNASHSEISAEFPLKEL